jgi:hypothetical protein
MKKINIEDLSSTFKNIKKQLAIEIDETDLIKQVTQLSTEITKLKQEKEYYENARKLLDIIFLNYSYGLDSYTNRVTIPTLKRDLEQSAKDLLKQIILKSEKLESYELLLDFTSYENFNQIMEIRNKKKKPS